MARPRVLPGPRRGVVCALLVSLAVVPGCVGAAAAPSPVMPGHGDPTHIAQARSSPLPPAAVQAAAPPPSPPVAPVDAGELEVRFVPVLFRAAADPFPWPVVSPLLPDDVRRLLEASTRLEDGTDPAPLQAARLRARKAIAAALGSTRPSAVRRAALLFTRGYLSEPGPSASDAAAEGEEAASLYREVSEAVPVSEPLGWLARFRHALLLLETTPGEASALLDALLEAPLDTPWMRGALAAVLAHPLRDWGRAARVARALWMSAGATVAATGARDGAPSLHAAWMVATYDDGNWQEAFDLARTELSGVHVKGPALAVAAAALVQLGGASRAPVDLGAETYAALVALTGERAASDGDLPLAEEAARLLAVRAPSSPSYAALLSSLEARRVEGQDPSEEARKKGFAVRARGLLGRCLVPLRLPSEREPAARGEDEGSVMVLFEVAEGGVRALPTVVAIAGDPLGSSAPVPPWLARTVACAQRQAASFFDGRAPFGHAVVRLTR